ncbi:hypothetical protein OROGR_022382 [Orobanche gracilis]
MLARITANRRLLTSSWDTLGHRRIKPGSDHSSNNEAPDMPHQNVISRYSSAMSQQLTDLEGNLLYGSVRSDFSDYIQGETSDLEST